MEFLKYLQQLELGKRLAIFWDTAARAGKKIGNILG
jgi:hypothetical protein